MKKFLSKIWQIICQEIQRRKLIANMICPKCKSQLIYRDCVGLGFWLACTGCNNEY